jgi:hypothetical protein
MIADIPALEAGSEDDDTEDSRGAGSEPSTHGSGAEAEGDSASASAPRETPVEDATGDQPELLGDEPEWGSEKDWSAEQWKAHARRYGVLLAGRCCATPRRNGRCRTPTVRRCRRSAI